MPRVIKPPVKSACLACRTSKTRCDGQEPCGSCSSRKRECSYRPSRRGGPRRGARYAEAQRRSTADNSLPSSVSDVTSEIEPFLDNMIGMVSPFAGVHNLDLSPDYLSIADGAHQIWGQLTPHGDDTFESVPAHNVGSSVIRAYQSEAEIANAYYIYIHPYLPLLPPQVGPLQEDRPTMIRPFGESSQAAKSHMPYWPTSSLSLALSAMLVLIPTTEDKFPMAETNLALRRSYAQLFAHAALAAAETETDDLVPALKTNLTETESLGLDGLHPQVPIQLSPVLALVVLAIYEYCQRGNISRMRARGNQAITTAMDISIHTLDSTTTRYSEAQRRAWWMTIWITYLSSSLHLSPPIVSLNDPRITTPYPKFDVYLEPWPMMMKSQAALYESSKMVQNIERVGETAVPPDFGTRIRNLDSELVSLIGEADRHLLATFDQEPEASVAQTMWMISRMFIHASRNRLHRFRAFMDIPLFLDKYCDLAAINSANFPHEASPPKWVTDCDISFPFTEQESSVICLKSALVITTIYRNLPYPDPLASVPSRSTMYPKTIPYFACSAMQSCYALLMLLHRLRASLATDRLASCYHLLQDPTPVSEIADAERLREELRHGVEILGRSLKSDVIFEGVGGMGREIEGAYLAAFPDCFEIYI